jgi:hypothetical protein
MSYAVKNTESGHKNGSNTERWEYRSVLKKGSKIKRRQNGKKEIKAQLND